MYVIGLLIGLAKFEPKQILECFFLDNNAWFVKAYIGLYILSPVLNIYCNNADEKTQLTVLLAFYVFQTIFGDFTMAASFIKAGFSTFSFIGLYLLARYMSVYGGKFSKHALLLFVLSTLCSVLWFYIPLRAGVMRIAYMSLLYTFPLCISSALFLLIWTARKPLWHSKLVNFIAGSVFAVFLCHVCNTWTHNLFIKISKDIYDSYSGVYYYGYILLFISCVFVLSILLDQIRKFVSNKIKFLNKKDS